MANDSQGAVKARFHVIKLKCNYCGEERYIVFFCEHCGENMTVAEVLDLTFDQLKELMRHENVEFYGHPDRVSQLVSDVTGDDPFLKQDTSVGSLSPSELDTLYDDGLSEI